MVVLPKRNTRTVVLPKINKRTVVLPKRNTRMADTRLVAPGLEKDDADHAIWWGSEGLGR